jgi:hypothetical protein
MELQLQRQQAQAQRQTLDRLARRPPATSAPAQVQPQGAAGGGGASVATAAKQLEQPSGVHSQSNFLLDELSSEDGSEPPSPGGGEARDLFIGELLLGALSIQPGDEEES